LKGFDSPGPWIRHMAGDPLDYVTVLTTKGPLATKRITAGINGQPPRVEGYRSAARFSIREAGVSNIDDLAKLLDTMQSRSFVVRGQPREGVDYRDARRRLHDRRNPDGTVTPATLQAAARHWIPLDVDHLSCPDWLDPCDDPDQTVEHVVERLPEEFHGATCWWSFTSSQGLKPNSIRLRLFFWADRPLADWQLKQWLADAPVDHSIFAPAQPIYVARPIFVGMPDPVPWRSGIWRGDRDEVTPPEIEKPQLRESQSAGVNFTGLAGSGYAFHRARIGDGPGLGGFHIPVKSAVAAWVARQGAGTDPAWLRGDLERAIRAAPRDPAKRDDDYIEFRADDLDPLITAIVELQAAREAAVPVYERVEPTYPPPMASVAAARAALAGALDRFATAALAYQAPLAMAA
jgi:hypothetical protein